MQLTEAMLQQTLVPLSGESNFCQPEIKSCESPEEVLSLLKNETFDVVFTDIQMPAMNGFELLKAIRGLDHPTAHSIPVIAITARGDIDVHEFKMKGFAGMLQKPFSRSDLRKVLVDTLSLTLQAEETEVVKETAVSFEPLLAFSEGDKEAAQEILLTFIQETEKNIHLLEQALLQKDMKTLGGTAHKMLPTFVMLNASDCVPILRWLESQRDADKFITECEEKVQKLLQSTNVLLESAKQTCIKK